MVVNSKNSVLLCITLYSLLLRETLWYSVVKLRLHPSLKKNLSFFSSSMQYLYIFCIYLLYVHQTSY
ncbi:hypothetical protein DW078_15545 [Bacteroides fragilis]|nr:hypothetical protein DW078_15545 [Bacteroides fragilis]